MDNAEPCWPRALNRGLPDDERRSGGYCARFAVSLHDMRGIFRGNSHPSAPAAVPVPRIPRAVVGLVALSAVVSLSRSFE